MLILFGLILRSGALGLYYARVPTSRRWVLAFSGGSMVAGFFLGLVGREPHPGSAARRQRGLRRRPGLAVQPVRDRRRASWPWPCSPTRERPGRRSRPWGRPTPCRGRSGGGPAGWFSRVFAVVTLVAVFVVSGHARTLDRPSARLGDDRPGAGGHRLPSRCSGGGDGTGRRSSAPAPRWWDSVGIWAVGAFPVHRARLERPGDEPHRLVRRRACTTHWWPWRWWPPSGYHWSLSASTSSTGRSAAGEPKAARDTNSELLGRGGDERAAQRHRLHRPGHHGQQPGAEHGGQRFRRRRLQSYHVGHRRVRRGTPAHAARAALLLRGGVAGRRQAAAPGHADGGRRESGGRGAWRAGSASAGRRHRHRRRATPISRTPRGARRR